MKLILRELKDVFNMQNVYKMIKFIRFKVTINVKFAVKEFK